MTSTDIINYKVTGFDNDKYKKSQIHALQERISKFSNGRLYLEIGGKFLFDPHAARVLPGFNPEVKTQIFKEINMTFDIVFCVNAQDIYSNRYMKSDTTSYTDYVKEMLTKYESTFGVKPYISINMINEENQEAAMDYKEQMGKDGYQVFNRYYIPGYPDSNIVVSELGYGQDDYIPKLSKLVLVVGPASNSGKLSTCLGQVYHDKERGETSGYAKYETFPIWNLPVGHPVNLAYEAATVDIGDFNLVDKYHLFTYNITAVNYNRDVAAFVILKNLISRIIDKDNFMATYKSPTDMGVNMAKEGITNDEVLAIAGYQEILRRKDWFYDLKDSKPNAKQWSVRCAKLSLRARQYIEEHKYDIDKVL